MAVESGLWHLKEKMRRALSHQHLWLLNLGVRYEYYTPVSETQGLLSNLVLAGNGPLAVANGSLITAKTVCPKRIGVTARVRARSIVSAHGQGRDSNNAD